MILFSLIICFLGLWAVLLFSWNKRYLESLKSGWEHFESDELVTVAIPARNEEAFIERCIRSLMKQRHSNLQILVLDDGSTDKTSEIVQRLSEQDKRITLLKGKPLPELWRGKIFAMQQLLDASKGNYILYSDADTVHSEDSVSYGLAIMQKKKVSFLSGYPTQLTPSLSVELIVIAMLFNPVLFVPFRIQQKLQSRLFAMAIGQYLLIKTDKLKQIGGFSSIKMEICDDVALARTFAKKGFGQLFAPMQDALECEMFPSFSVGWHSLERSINAVVKQGWIGLILILLIVIVLIALSLSPLVTLFLAYQAITGSASYLPFMLSLGGNVLLIGAWKRAAVYFKFSTRSGYLAHVTIFLVVIMYLHGLYLRLSGKGFMWKGRNVL